MRRRTSINWRISSGVTFSTAWITTVAPAICLRVGEQVVGRDARAGFSARRCDRLFLERLDFLEQAAHSLADLARRDAERGGQIAQDLLFLAHVVERGLADQGRDPPRAGGHRLLADDLEQATCPTLSRCVPPQSSREKSPIWTTRTMSGYFSPKRAIAPWALACSIGMCDQLTGAASRTLQVDGLLDGAEPVAADRLGIGEVEPQPVGLDLAAGLLGVLAQDACGGRGAAGGSPCGRGGSPARRSASTCGMNRLVDRHLALGHAGRRAG